MPGPPIAAAQTVGVAEKVRLLSTVGETEAESVPPTALHWAVVAENVETGRGVGLEADAWQEVPFQLPPHPGPGLVELVARVHTAELLHAIVQRGLGTHWVPVQNPPHPGVPPLLFASQAACVPQEIVQDLEAVRP